MLICTVVNVCSLIFHNFVHVTSIVSLILSDLSGGMATHRPAILYHLIQFCVSFNAVPKQLTLIMRHYTICTLQYIHQQHTSDNIC
jgi:hypothetical protein